MAAKTSGNCLATANHPSQRNGSRQPARRSFVVLTTKQSKALLYGDALATRNVLTSRSVAPQMMAPVLIRDDLLGIKSLGRFREPGEVTLLPGHGGAWHGSLETVVP